MILKYNIYLEMFSYDFCLQVVRLMRDRSLGNSASRTMKVVQEQHDEAYLIAGMAYMSTCQSFQTSLAEPRAFKQPPPPSRVPTLKWYINIYVRDVLARMEECKAKVTSTLGAILKIDSTKKVKKNRTLE